MWIFLCVPSSVTSTRTGCKFGHLKSSLKNSIIEDNESVKLFRFYMLIRCFNDLNTLIIVSCSALT